MALTTTNGSGSQQNTDSPQTSQSGNFGGQKASSVQPGTATNLLNSSGTTGVPLNNTPITQVSLGGASTQATTAAPAKSTTSHHHANPALLGVVSIVFLVAAVMFWSIARSAKNTTDY